MRQPAIVPKHQGCLHAGPPVDRLSLKDRIAVGFGDARLTRNGKTIWSEIKPKGGVYAWRSCWTVRRAEARAVKDYRADWRIILDGPMRGQTYQRQGPSNWVCIESNGGFA